MNILGVGPGELAVVFIIMLVVAGPKRMVQWASPTGRYTAELRAMFQETLNAVQKELAESGLDIRKDLPNIPTGRIDFVREASKIINPPTSAADNTEQPAASPDSNTSTAQSAAPTESNDSVDNTQYEQGLLCYR